MRDIENRDAGLGAGRCPSDEPTLMALRVPPQSKVLDLGCSTATMAPVLRSQGCYVVGLDNDAAALQLAKERCSAVVLADLNDPHALDGVDRDFDVILCNGMLGHVAEPNLLLTNLHNHLAETGCLIVSISDITHKGAPSVPRQAEGNDADRSSRDLTQRPFVTCEFVSRLFADTGWLITECEPAETPHDAETKVLGDAGSDALLGAADAELEDQLSRCVITAHRR